MKLSFLFFLSILTYSLNGYAQNDILNSMREYADKRNQNIKERISSLEIFSVDDSIGVDVDLYSVLNDTRPKKNKIYKVYMGDRMIHERKGYFSECFKPFFSHNVNLLGGWNLLIKEGVPICKKSAKSKNFDNVPYVNGKNGNDIALYHISLKYYKKKDVYKICMKTSGLSATCKKDIKQNEFEISNGFVSVENELQRTIEYSGKSGNELRFIYSEFISGYARDAFNREFTMDISEGSTTAYKGAVFEVISADNASIVYKVIRHFPQ